MANNYLEFSEVIDNLTPEEINWWENDAKNIGNEDDNTICYDFELQKDKKAFGSTQTSMGILKLLPWRCKNSCENSVSTTTLLLHGPIGVQNLELDNSMVGRCL